MTQITLTSDQSQALAAATDGVVIADQDGNIIASIPPKLTDKEAALVAEAQRRLTSDQPRVPSSDVLDRLSRLGGARLGGS